MDFYQTSTYFSNKKIIFYAHLGKKRQFFPIICP
jgi:hypothetical protein